MYKKSFIMVYIMIYLQTFHLRGWFANGSAAALSVHFPNFCPILSNKWILLRCTRTSYYTLKSPWFTVFSINICGDVGIGIVK
jgi:hypothetical protein